MTKISNDVRHYLLMDRLQSSEFPKNIEKKAETVAELTLTELILKLSDSLREKNMTKAANEVEEKFIIYKQADTHLYRAHDEDGEDLIDFAHPKGDHNVEDGELGDVETIVSKHKKIVEVVQKNPTGKLASYVSQCKIALGQAGGDKANRVQQMDEVFASWRQYVLTRVNWIKEIVEAQGNLRWYSGNGPLFRFYVNKVLEHLQAEPLNIEHLNDAIDRLEGMKDIIQGHSGIAAFMPGTGVSEDLFNRISAVVTDVEHYIREMIKIENQKLDLTTPSTSSGTLSLPADGEPMLGLEERQSKIDELTGRMNKLMAAYEAKVSTGQVPQEQQRMYTDWFTAEKNDIAAVKTNSDYNKRLAELNEFTTKSGL